MLMGSADHDTVYWTIVIVAVMDGDNNSNICRNIIILVVTKY